MKSSYHLLEVTPAALTEIKNSKPLGIQSLILPYGGTCTKIITMTKKKKTTEDVAMPFSIVTVVDIGIDIWNYSPEETSYFKITIWAECVHSTSWTYFNNIKRLIEHL